MINKAPPRLLVCRKKRCGKGAVSGFLPGASGVTARVRASRASSSTAQSIPGASADDMRESRTHAALRGEQRAGGGREGELGGFG